MLFAEDGPSKHQTVKSQRPNAALLDIEMPGMRASRKWPVREDPLKTMTDAPVAARLRR